MEKEQNNFVDLQLYVGIDVHKKQWSVSIYTPSSYHRTFSQPPHPKALKNYLDKHFDGARIKCAYEACKFGFWIHRELTSLGYECLVVNAADIPTSNKESAEKADPSDSRKIGKALRAGLLTSIHVPEQHTQGARQLFRYRKRLWSDLVRVKNRIKDKFLFTGTELPKEYDNSNWTKAFIQWVKNAKLPDPHTRLTVDMLLEQYHFLYRHFLRVSVEVRKLQRQSNYKTNAKLLRSIPGIGPLTTVQLLTEIEDINRFASFKKFNGYVGFKPTTFSSGEHDWRGRITYRKNRALRSALIECAWTTVSSDPIMLKRYEELKKRLTGKRAIVIIARKLLSRIYFVLKKQKPYEIGVAK